MTKKEREREREREGNMAVRRTIARFLHIKRGKSPLSNKFSFFSLPDIRGNHVTDEPDGGPGVSQYILGISIDIMSFCVCLPPLVNFQHLTVDCIG